MFVLLSISWLAVCLLYFLFIHILNPVFFSPLRKIPAAHPTSHVSSLWMIYHRRGGRHAVPVLADVHSRKGPIVRLGPNELSVSSLEGCKKVFIERGGFAKPKWWAAIFQTYGVKNLGSMQGGPGTQEHPTRKKIVGNLYAKSTILCDTTLQENIGVVLGDLRQAVEDAINKDEGVLEAYSFNGAAHADVTSIYLFGRSSKTNLLQSSSARLGYYFNHDTWARGKPGYAQAKVWLEQFGMQLSQSAETALVDEEKSSSDGVVYRQLHTKGLRGKVLTSEVFDHFLAGAEGPRTTLTYLQWALSKRPDMQARLKQEISLLDNDDIVSDLKALDALPLLDAILTETLRVYTAVPGTNFRIAPPEGVRIHDFFIPGGTIVSASFHILHHNASIFPDPGHWDPDRWLIDDQAKVDEMRKWIWAFSKGSRICIAKDFTLIVMKVIIAFVYSHYCTEVVDDAGMEQEDKFVSGPVGGKLMLRFQQL